MNIADLFQAAILTGTFLPMAVGVPSAMASPEPQARLISHNGKDCLLISGQRNTAKTQVRINGNVVPVEGDRRWHTCLPVDTVRQWSAPFARSIKITLSNPETHQNIQMEASLPIGLLGHSTKLTSLVISLD